MVFSSELIVAQNNDVQKFSPSILLSRANKPKNDTLTVWIYFKDKEAVDKNRSAFSLPPNSLKRRLKGVLENQGITIHDLPVVENYVHAIESLIIRKRVESRWLNAVSVEAYVGNMDAISEFPFVRKIDLVKRLRTEIDDQKQKKLDHDCRTSQENMQNYSYDYGQSFNQNHTIRIPELHKKGLDGSGVLICMMDAGFNNLSHPAMENIHIVGTWDFVNNDSVVSDQMDQGSGNHGTFTLSAMAGFNNGCLIGPAFNASFVLTKTENTESETPVEEDNWVAAMEWAEYNFGPDITSTSLGYRFFDDGTGYSIDELDGNTSVITIAADIAASLGIIVVNSMGNNGPNPSTMSVPADGDSVLSVGATFVNGFVAQFSSRGPTGDGRIKPDVVAPGESVFCASPFDMGYVRLDGTSMSCPLVAGTAALLVQAFPNATNMEIITAIKVTSRMAHSPNNDVGWGLINGIAAYHYLSGKPHIIHQPFKNSSDLSGPYVIHCQVLSKEPLLVGYPHFWYRQGGGNFTLLSMRLISGDIYEAEINGVGFETTYDYYISALNTNGLHSVPENAPDEFFSFYTFLSSTHEELSISRMLVYPNPGKDIIYIQYNGVELIDELRIYAMDGRCSLILKNPQFSTNVDISNYNSGLYMVVARVGKKVIQKHFVK
ncbi:MAG: S8 family peptidase [Salinivirgaceae bacterium]|nr:S8 family peptidase [Salinivirgaceae bacterium]